MKSVRPDFAEYPQQLMQPLAMRSPSQIVTGSARVDGASGRPIHLTPRELEVLALLCEGLPNKLISRRLDISSATVKCHISRILSELGVSSRLQAVVAAARHGLVPDPTMVGAAGASGRLHGTPANGLHGSPMPVYAASGPA